VGRLRGDGRPAARADDSSGRPRQFSADSTWRIEGKLQRRERHVSRRGRLTCRTRAPLRGRRGPSCVACAGPADGQKDGRGVAGRPCFKGPMVRSKCASVPEALDSSPSGACNPEGSKFRAVDCGTQSERQLCRARPKWRWTAASGEHKRTNERARTRVDAVCGLRWRSDGGVFVDCRFVESKLRSAALV
jgi:hypothetical protein